MNRYIRVQHFIILFILIISSIYIIFIYPFVSMPPLGRHAWNEAIYLTFLHTITQNNNPYLYYQAYDINRPDFNVGYVYFWTNYIFFKIYPIYNNEIITFRFTSILSTLISIPILFLILKEFDIRKFTACNILIFYLFSPLVLYFGWKAQLEPFLILLFFISQLLLIRYIKYRKEYNLYSSCILEGVLIVSRSNFIVFLPLYIILYFILNKKNRILNNLKGITIVCVLISFGIFITILPSLILYSQYDQIAFLYNRIFGAGLYAFSSGKSIENIIQTFINDALWKQTLILFPLSGLSLLFIKKFKIQRELISYYLLLLLVSWIFLLLTYIHTANHIYQMYYVILLFTIGSGILLDILKDFLKKFYVYFILSIMIINIILSYNYIHDFYGLYTEKIYNGDIDAYGTYESYNVGNTIGYILNDTKANGYILTQSPTVYYPTYHQSITYYENYKWNKYTQQYTLYSYFDNEKNFLDNIKNRDIDILTITPDIFPLQTKKFKHYVSFNFIDTCHTKNFIIFLNKSIFYRDESIKLKCNNFLHNLSIPKKK